MRLRTLAVAALVLVSVVVSAQKHKKLTLPAIFGTAQSVYVQGELGDIHWPGLCPGDRQAIVDTENAIQSWDRYSLAPDRNGAELVFIVRRGQPGVGSEREPNIAGPAAKSPAGQWCGSRPESDLLEVRRMDKGHLSSPIWSHIMIDGLDGPRVPLLEALKDEVDKEYPKP
jgi:hypothetical protein